MSRTEGWDDIVVGGGSSGAVLASRLSEDPRRRVLLLEAGPDFPDGAPAVIEDARVPVASGYNWDYSAQVKAGSLPSSALQTVRAMAAAPVRDVMSAAAAAVTGSARVGDALTQFPYFVGKVIGGSSAINGALALRAASSDFAAWAAAGNDAWGWSEVLPEFLALEHDRDFTEGHGKAGPVPIARPPAQELAGFHSAFLEACREQQLAEVRDLNADPVVGVGPIPRNVDGDRRMSSSAAYLSGARGRKNLEIRGGLLVDRVLLEGRRAVGVEAVNGGARVSLRADRVSLCAGAINSPAILLRSGIGAPARCRAIGVEPVAEIPAVGEGLMDHPAVVLWATPRPGVCREYGHFHHLLARIASRTGEPPDLNLMSIANVRTDSVPMLGSLLRMPWAVGVSVLLARPASKGRTFPTRRDPAARPIIELDLCSARSDVQRLMHGVRQGWRAMSSTPVRQCIVRPFAWTDRIIENDGLLGSAIRGFVGSAWHAAGSARMGPDGDAGAVVDQRCRVRAVEGLRVADASVMPSLPSVPLNLTCLMIAERVARWMQ